jgi:hypothetical protein
MYATHEDILGFCGSIEHIWSLAIVSLSKVMSSHAVTKSLHRFAGEAREACFIGCSSGALDSFWEVPFWNRCFRYPCTICKVQGVQFFVLETVPGRACLGE